MTGRWTTIVVLAAALSGAAPGCGTGEPPPDPAEGLRIAYNVLEDSVRDDYEVYVMNLDGSGRTNISRSPGVDWVYYAHGDRIYFISDRDTSHRVYFLYTMDAEGKDVRRICPFRLEDSWLSARNDGSEVVVCGRRGSDRWTLYVVAVADGSVRQLTTDTSQYFSDPFFSPDGREIAFRHRARKRDRSEPDEIRVMRDDGTVLRQVTTYPAGDTTAEPHDYHAGPPFWEPNRNVISFISKRNGNYSIFTIRPDGTGERQLTPDGFDEGWHAWSPDGSLIAYNGSEVGGEEYDIWIMNADGSGARRIPGAHRVEQGPVFVRAPAGK